MGRIFSRKGDEVAGEDRNRYNGKFVILIDEDFQNN
jgi:hypothetical protein